MTRLRTESQPIARAPRRRRPPPRLGQLDFGAPDLPSVWWQTLGEDHAHAGAGGGARIAPADGAPQARGTCAQPAALEASAALEAADAQEAQEARELVADLLALADAGLIVAVEEHGTTRYAAADPDEPGW
jgi:hypothetical protein